MEWLLAAAGVLLAAAGVLALFVAFSYRRRLENALNINSNLVYTANQARAADNALVLSVLAREIANELMQRDAESYKKRFERLYYKWQEIEKKDVKDKLACTQIITSKYVTFLDFDELGTKVHVLYADGFSFKSDDDLWDTYENIRLFDALNCELDEEWRRHGASISENEYEHLNKYCKKLGDTKLLAHLYKAREQFDYLKRSGVEQDSESEWQYETKDYNFKRIAHIAESRWGVHVKAMDRYGMWGLFVDEKAYTSFYAADKDFNEEVLDSLHIRLCLDAREYSSIEGMAL